MLEYWRNGVMEEWAIKLEWWNVGRLEYWVKLLILDLFPIIPLLHYSNFL